MKACIFITAICLLSFINTCLAGQKKQTIETWLDMRHKQLSAIEVASSVKRSKLDISDDKNKDGLYALYPKKGYIRFKDGSWILLASHSVHAEDGLPDISLIRTSTGKYYSNLGHCCLPILLYSKVEIKSVGDFILTTGKGPKGNPTSWIEYKD